ncbi:MAG: ribulokinase [Bacteroidetes bacterium]|nr:ribulokinase [Bacteroidota bacterium]
MTPSFVIGIDYGTDSVRSVIVDAQNGEEVASSLYFYPRWRDGLYCDPSKNMFRQHPLDYVEGLETSVKRCLDSAGETVRKNIRAMSVDTTGSTPVAVDQSGKPLSLHHGFEKNPNAMFVLWKDHTSTREAAEINEHARKFKVDYLKYVGGIYSSEWFWAKLLHVLRSDEHVRHACYSWVEHCDWIPFMLTGGKDVHQMTRGVCSAGHKALWAKEFGGLPPDDFFATLDPALKGFTSRLFMHAETADRPAGYLCAEWASRLNLTTGVVVGVGAFDAHMGAVGGQIEPYHLSKVMGTSTCDMLVAPRHEVNEILVRGICGQVDGSVIPGMIGMEAGQSAFGDTYAWFKDLLSWPLEHLLKESTLIDHSMAERLFVEMRAMIIPALSSHAQKRGGNTGGELAMDWLNGRRTPDANQELKAGIAGLNLASGAPEVFRALAESTCFGARAIVDRFRQEGIPVKGLIGLGGVAKKSPYVMQMMANVMNMPLRIHKSEQTCAAGAAMFAATAAGIYPKVEEAMQAMGQGFDVSYHPDSAITDYYEAKYKSFQEFGKLLEGFKSAQA